jgi:hypothetical protein
MKTAILSMLIVFMLSLVATAETVKVTTRENAVRGECRFFAPVKLKVSLGDELTVKGRKGDWIQVGTKGINGCIHKSAVESRNFAASGRKTGGDGASSDEVSLAGKGFNPQVEASYRKSGKNLNYAAVDEIAKFTTSEKSLETFVQQGGLKQP